MVDQRPVPSAVWSLRIALFSGALALAGIALHRLFGLPTPVLLNMIKAALGGAAVALLLAFAAMIWIWRTGRPGAAATLVAVLASLALLGWPAVFVPAMARLPKINDVTTDPQSPPAFAALARLRGPGSNPAAYPGAEFAALQQAAYPDLRTFRVNRSAEEAFELAAEATRRLKFQIVSETPPGLTTDKPGTIEAVDRTLIMGFYDDLVIRISGDQRSASVDVRSASRFGEHDLGRNASRVRAVLKELRARLESTVPGTAGQRIVRGRSRTDKLAVPKRQKPGDRKPGDRRSEPDRARSDAQRAPEPTARPR